MSMLTTEGALQLVKLGTYLHESHSSPGLFEREQRFPNSFLIKLLISDINSADIEFCVAISRTL